MDMLPVARGIELIFSKIDMIMINAMPGHAYNLKAKNNSVSDFLIESSYIPFTLMARNSERGEWITIGNMDYEDWPLVFSNKAEPISVFMSSKIFGQLDIKLYSDFRLLLVIAMPGAVPGNFMFCRTYIEFSSSDIAEVRHGDIRSWE